MKILFFLLSPLLLIAQIDIEGQVKDKNSLPVAYANLSLIHPENNQLISGTVTNEEGFFTLPIQHTGKIRLVISFIGYQTLEIDTLVSEGKKKIDFGTLILEDESQNLGEVTVKALRPIIKIEPGKTIVQVEGTVMAQGNSVFDVIAKSPGIYVDQNDQIVLNGRSGVNVMIDNRPSYMSGSELANFLRSLPAENLKSIEIISVPGSGFDAEGSAGIINIKLKKNTVEGINGNIHFTNFYNSKYGNSGGTGIQMKRKNLLLSGTFNFRNQPSINELEIDRTFSTSDFIQDSRIDASPLSGVFNFSSEYSLNDQHKIGGSFLHSGFREDNFSRSLTEIRFKEDPKVSVNRSTNEAEYRQRRIFSNVFYVGNLDSLGKQISVDIDFTRLTGDSEGFLNNVSDESFSITNLNNLNYSIVTAKSDFILPFGNQQKYEAGVKFSRITADNDIDLSHSILGSINSNRFLYDEKVMAAYSSFLSPLGKSLTLNLGLRLEYSDITGNSTTLNLVNRQTYFSLFPTVFLGQNVNDRYSINYSFSRRITRPNYRLLNPFLYYIDPFTTEQGNPGLKPQFSYIGEFSHILDSKYQLAFRYAITSDVFQQIFTQDEIEKSTTTYTANLQNRKDFSIQLMAPVNFSKWWNSAQMVAFNYNSWNSLIGEDLLDVSQTSFTLRSQHSLSLPAGLKMEIMMMYLSRFRDGQINIKGFGWTDIGLSKNILKDKLSLTLNMDDIFASQVVDANILFGLMNTDLRQYRFTQSVRLTARYNFVKGVKVRVQNRSGSVEERGRLD
jgi:hypothetical protein